MTIQSNQRETELKDQLRTITHDLQTLLATLGGKDYSTEVLPANLLQLLKSMVSQQQEKILSLSQNVGFHDDHMITLFVCIWLLMLVKDS